MVLQASRLHQPNPSTSERACIVGTMQTQPLPTTHPPTILLQLANARHHKGVATAELLLSNRGRLPTGAASAHFSLFRMAIERRSKERRHAMEALTRRCQGCHCRVPSLNQSEMQVCGQRKLRKRYDTSKQYLQVCFDWRSIGLPINCGDSANGSGAGTRYNWVVVRARKVEDSDHRSWPGSSTAERVLPGGATTGLHFDIGPTAGAERAALRSSNLRSEAKQGSC